MSDSPGQRTSATNAEGVRARPGIVARVLILIVTAYKAAISPILPPACRFEPTCSVYTADAIRTLGAARGTWLGLKRIVRCRPGGGSGFDPVPPE